MFRKIKLLGLAISAVALSVSAALATPSTQVWIPSTDIQPYGVVHLTVDTYLREAKDDNTKTFWAPMEMVGPTVGILPYQKLQAEVGFDLVYAGAPADNYPFYGNFKIGTPEGSLFDGSPAIAAGAYALGTKKDVTNQNIMYALVAKTVGPLGRVSLGWYTANDDVVGPDSDGLLASWDRTLPEISDKLWVAVDYQGGKNALGALNVGLAWTFAPNASVIFGYDMYNDKDIAGENTFTVQVDLNFL